MDFCRLHDITIHPRPPFQYGFIEGVFLESDKFPELNTVIDKIAAKYQVTNTTIAIAWLLRHPAKNGMRSYWQQATNCRIKYYLKVGPADGQHDFPGVIVFAINNLISLNNEYVMLFSGWEIV